MKPAHIIVLVVSGTLFLLALLSWWEADGYRYGYLQGFADQKAGLCQERFIVNCGRNAEKKGSGQ